jgi:UDP-N-acetylglucosamine 2-epimerase (non-hydrolysing)
MKVMTIVGTRPEIIRLSRVIPALDAAFDHRLVHTGQNYDYELNQALFEDLELRAPDRFLEAAGESACDTIGRIISAADAALAEEQPDAVLILGDTNSCLAAIPAKRRHIPVFHMEAGNRCFDERVPEETNRRIVDHIADVNLPYSDISREYLLREGLPADRTIKTGSPMYEVLAHYAGRIDVSTAVKELALTPQEYFLVSAHREENIDDPEQFVAFVDLLQRLGGEYGLPIVLSAHPRTRARLESVAEALPSQLRMLKPFRFTDYVNLEINSTAVLSDSGTISEEASILNLRALNIRRAHERPEAMEEAAVMLTGMSWARVREALAILATQPRGEERALRLVADYSVPNVSAKVVRLILSYTDYVNAVVWRR